VCNHFQHELELDGDVERQRGLTDGRASTATGVTEDVDDAS
jgi:hypothetical protein